MNILAVAERLAVEIPSDFGSSGRSFKGNIEANWLSFINVLVTEVGLEFGNSISWINLEISGLRVLASRILGGHLKFVFLLIFILQKSCLDCSSLISPSLSNFERILLFNLLVDDRAALLQQLLVEIPFDLGFWESRNGAFEFDGFLLGDGH